MQHNIDSVSFELIITVYITTTFIILRIYPPKSLIVMVPSQINFKRLNHRKDFVILNFLDYFKEFKTKLWKIDFYKFENFREIYIFLACKLIRS